MSATPSQLFPTTCRSEPGEQIKEAAAHMIAPAQHEIHQERHEAGHQQHVIERPDISVDVGEQRRRLGMDAHFGNLGWRGGRFRGLAPRRRRVGLGRGTPAAAALPGSVWESPPRKFASPRRPRASPRYPPVRSCAGCKAGSACYKAGKLRVQPQAQQIQDQQGASCKR